MKKESITINNLKNNARYRDKQTIKRFEKIKDTLGINADSEIVRYCINFTFNKLREQR